MEKHFKKPVMLSLEWPLYRHLLSLNYTHDNVDHIMKVLTGKNQLRGRHGFRAVVYATRMSGEMNTSLGNGWSNFIVFNYIVHSKGGICYGFVEGDDGIFASSVPVTTQDYNDLGFDVKVNELTTVTEASFCGIISAADGTLVKDPGVVMMKFGWTSSYITAGDIIMHELLRAKALSLCYECPQCPVVGAIGRRALQVTRNYNPRFIKDGYHDTDIVPRDESSIPEFKPTPASRTLFARLFGVTVENQLRCEDAIMRDDLTTASELIPTNYAALDYYLRYLETD